MIETRKKRKVYQFIYLTAALFHEHIDVYVINIVKVSMACKQIYIDFFLFIKN